MVDAVDVDTGKGAKSNGLPWVEKYRPKELDDIVGNQETVATLKEMAKRGNMQNLLFAGAPGVGKTTSLMCLARAILGSNVKKAVLRLNASDERGIDVVRQRIKTFGQTKIDLPAGCHKIVFLDEADGMTKGAQQALRATMESFSHSTRFVFSCNISTKIIEPIQSRCAIIRFTRLSDKDVLGRLLDVCIEEGVKYDEEGLEMIILLADGDMRQALHNLQATFNGFSIVNKQSVLALCTTPPPIKIQNLVTCCSQVDLDAAVTIANELLGEGYSTIDVVSTLFKVVSRMPELQEWLKLEYLKDIGFCHMILMEGLESPLQVSALLAKMCEKSHTARN